MREPVQPPLDVQLVASVLLQVSAELPPGAMVVGAALRVTVGAGAGVTSTVTVCTAEWPAPLQVTVNSVVVARVGVACDPAVASEPDQPPDAVHDVALVDDQVSIEVLPATTEVGEADKVTVGKATCKVGPPPLPHALKARAVPPVIARRAIRLTGLCTAERPLPSRLRGNMGVALRSVWDLRR